MTTRPTVAVYRSYPLGNIAFFYRNVSRGQYDTAFSYTWETAEDGVRIVAIRVAMSQAQSNPFSIWFDQYGGGPSTFVIPPGVRLYRGLVMDAGTNLTPTPYPIARLTRFYPGLHTGAGQSIYGDFTLGMELG